MLVKAENLDNENLVQQQDPQQWDFCQQEPR